MEDLRIATPPRAARARKRHELPKEKKKSAFAKVVDHVRQTLFGENDKIKEEAKLTGLGDEDDDETSQAGSTIAEANEPVAPRPSIWLRLKNTGRKYLAGVGCALRPSLAYVFTQRSKGVGRKGLKCVLLRAARALAVL
jgi:hypothetical protein